MAQPDGGGARLRDEQPVRAAAEAAREIKEDYAQGEDRPLGSYLAIMAAYLAVAAVTGVVLRRRRVPLPPRLSWSDIALGAMATHRLSRLVTKDAVASPLRAPFTRFQGVSGPAELAEDVKGTGPAHAVGELLTCPFCLAQWVASGFMVGLLVAPRATRVIAGVFSMVGLADILHLLYQKLED